MAKKALCIGINDYPGTASDLAGCVNDAGDWERELESRGFEVKKLLDQSATGVALREGIAHLLASAASGDCVVITYSGHGSFVPDKNGDEPDGTDECLCPHDVQAKGVITDDELFDLLSDRERGVRLIMISDSCHSGTVSRFNPIVTPPTVKGRGAPQRKVRFLPPASFLPARKLAGLGLRGPMRTASPPGRHDVRMMRSTRATGFCVG